MEKTPKNLLSERVNNLSESATIAMARKSRELKAQGIDVISLSLGEPDFNTPDFIKKAAKEGIDQNYSKYIAADGKKKSYVAKTPLVEETKNNHK